MTEIAMIDTAAQSAFDIARIVRGQGNSRWWRARRPVAEIAAVNPKWIAIRIVRSLEGVRAQGASDAQSLLAEPNVEIHFIRPESWPTRIAIVSLIKDQNGHAWDALVGMQLHIHDAACFVARCSALISSQEGPIDSGVIESWLLQRIDFRLREAAAKYTATQLLTDAAMPAQAWEARLNDLLADYGIRCSITDLKYTSASAELAERQSLDREFANRREQEELRRQNDELEQQRQKADLERRRHELDLNHRIGAAERARKLAELDHEALLQAHSFLQQRERWQLEIESAAIERTESLSALRKRYLAEETRQQAMLSAQLEAIKRDDQLATLKSALEKQELERKLRESVVQTELAADRLEVEKRELELKKLRYEEALKRIQHQATQRHQGLADLADQSTEFASALHGSNLHDVHQAKETLASPEIGLPVEMLAAAGMDVSRQEAIDFLKSRAKLSPGQLKFRKSDLITRDIGTRKERDILPLHSRLDFELRSNVEGYATIFNLGTSGRCWLLAPSAACPARICRVSRGNSYRIPGHPLFPNDKTLEEQGPPGWEHVAAIVSDFPLVSEKSYLESSDDSPIVEIPFAEIVRWVDKLEFNSASWAAAVLSFKVEG